MLRALNKGVVFSRSSAFNYMATGGVSATNWYLGQKEYLRALEQHGFIDKVAKRHVFRKWLQSIYLRLGLNLYKRQLRRLAGLARKAAFDLGMRLVFPMPLRRWILRIRRIVRIRGHYFRSETVGAS